MSIDVQFSYRAEVPEEGWIFACAVHSLVIVTEVLYNRSWLLQSKAMHSFSSGNESICSRKKE